MMYFSTSRKKLINYLLQEEIEQEYIIEKVKSKKEADKRFLYKINPKRSGINYIYYFWLKFLFT